MNELVKTDAQEIMEAVISKGDLSKLTPAERNTYYDETCRSVGLNPLTRPFEYITLQGKQTLYARRDAADQLRKIHGISIEIMRQELKDGLFIVHVRASDKTGRQDEDIGAVPMAGGAAEIRANQTMKAITKAKRRVTLSICGLGFPDETEIEDIAREEKKASRKVKTITSSDKPKQITEVSPQGKKDQPAATAAPSRPPESNGAADFFDSDRLAEWDGRLAMAAEHGGTPGLEAEWRAVPEDLKPALKAALDRRHKPAAELVDAI